VEVSTAVPEAVVHSGNFGSAHSTVRCNAETASRKVPHAAQSASSEALVVEPSEAEHVLGVSTFSVEDVELDEVVPGLLRLSGGTAGREGRTDGGSAGSVGTTLEVGEADLGGRKVTTAGRTGVEGAHGCQSGRKGELDGLERRRKRRTSFSSSLVPRQSVFTRLLRSDTGPVTVADGHRSRNIPSEGGEGVVEESLPKRVLAR
jgi:hypothetical protein